MVKRNIARLVPLMKKAAAAARVVSTPAVAVAGIPVNADWVLVTKWALRSTPCRSIASYMALFEGEYAGTPAAESAMYTRSALSSVLNGTSSRTMPTTVAT